MVRSMPRDLSLRSVPINGRFPDSRIITQHHAFPIFSVAALNARIPLSVYSDEIVQDFHPLPFYLSSVYTEESTAYLI